MDEEVTAELVEEIKKSIKDISVTINNNTKTYTFKILGASLKSFNKESVSLNLKCQAPEPPKKEEKKEAAVPIKQAKQLKPEEKPEPKSKPEPEPEPEPKPKPKAVPKEEPKLESKISSNKSTDAVPDDEPKLVQKSSSNRSRGSGKKRRSTAGPKEEPKLESKVSSNKSTDAIPDDEPKLVQRSSSNRSRGGGKKRRSTAGIDGKPSASKCIFGTLKTMREKRVHLSTAKTMKGCEYIPMQKASERGCVLKKSNDELEKCGIIRKSSIELINNVDVSGEPLKKIKKMLTEYMKLDKQYTIQFEIPAIELSTQEMTFNGAFCPNVVFTKEYDGNNYIIDSIPNVEGNKYLLNKADLKRGYKLFKVSGSSVNNKPFNEIKKMLSKAGKDNRVQYQVTFIEGKWDWYNFNDPYPNRDDDEKKIDVPSMKNKTSSGKSPRKSPTKSPKKTPRSPYTPSTPSGKNPKYFLKDKKNEKVYFDIRIDGDKRGRIEIVLFMNVVPKTATNFLKLCTGDNKKKLTYKGKKFYKMYIGMGIEGGDVENNDGSGNLSIYGTYFDDENFKIRHAQYALTMVNNNDEPNTNSSKFMIITADDAEYLDGKNVVFGYIANKESQNLIDDMEEEGCSLTGKPKCKVVISKCGKLKK